ncbi:hypothetical protein PRUPE_7G128100 [Prunus persica]|uniref:Uncharacterized protein n=1 Tax=Prunus persica TaxID=3760 RepID=A0A251NAP3_PRUPE|nr:hypothetical protein PRUPE_7G128100 [Prunus persica]
MLTKTLHISFFVLHNKTITLILLSQNQTFDSVDHLRKYNPNTNQPCILIFYINIYTCNLKSRWPRKMVQTTQNLSRQPQNLKLQRHAYGAERHTSIKTT